MELHNLFPITVDLEVIMPTGEPTGITLKVVGQDSKQFRDASKKIAATMIGRDEDEKPDVELLEAQSVDMAAACVVGWTGLEHQVQNEEVNEQGETIVKTRLEPLPYSSAKAVELLSMPQLTFMRQQVEAFVSKRAAFFRKST
jgi:hypothetical protein